MVHPGVNPDSNGQLPADLFRFRTSAGTAAPPDALGRLTVQQGERFVGGEGKGRRLVGAAEEPKKGPPEKGGMRRRWWQRCKTTTAICGTV